MTTTMQNDGHKVKFGPSFSQALIHFHIKGLNQ